MRDVVEGLREHVLHAVARVPRTANTLALGIVLIAAAALGPVCAIALAAGGGSSGLSGPSGLGGGNAPSPPTVTVTTPCSGSLRTTTTTRSPATTTPIATTVTTYSVNAETISIPSTPAIATFTMELDGEPTYAIAADADPLTVADALIAAVPSLQNDIVVTGAGGPGGVYTITFEGALAGQPQETIQATGYDASGDPAPLPVTNTEPVATGVVTTTTTETTPGTTTVKVTPACPPSAPPAAIGVPKSNPFNGRAMWIWELPSSNGGNVASIIARAKRYGINALYIKSSDGTGWWSQFSKGLVNELHKAGLKVCAWQYVYGLQPVVEADLGAKAVHDGADCLVIDAESQYQGRYTAAQAYIGRLRKLVGSNFPVGLAGFPYVDEHLSFPYSVFLGPGGAQYNLPQMYWADIGTTVPTVFAHTYEYNTIYRRPIFPLGQLWNSGSGMSAASIEQFNTLAKEYGATGVSWWDWQSAPASYWSDMTRTGPFLVSFVAKTPASVYRGNKGDPVIWAQEHLRSAGYKIAVDGDFGPQTEAAVKSFQGKHGLRRTGVIDGPTWNLLDSYTPVSVRWTQKRGVTRAVLARAGRIAGRSARETLVEPVPSWTRHVHSRNELHGDLGAGRPRNARF